MTTQSALVLAAIVSGFLIFGIVLASVDFYSQRGRKQANENTAPAGDGHRNLPDMRRAA